MILTRSNIKEFDIDSAMRGRIEANELEKLLVIVPTNRKIRDLKKEIISLAPGGATGKINLETLGTFSTKLLFDSGEIRGTILGDAAATVLLKQSFQQIKAKYFSNYKDDIPFGTLERIKNVISEYKKHGISADDLRREAEELTGSEKLKAADIADIYEKYKSNCDRLGVREIGDVYIQLNAMERSGFEKRFRKFFPCVELIIILGFDEFTKPEIEIITSTSALPGLDLLLSFDYSPSNSFLFAHLDRCYENLREEGFRAVKDNTELKGNSFRASVRINLFNGRKREKIGEFSEKIVRINARGRRKEIELIAKEIKSLISEKDISPDRICVALNLIQKYSPTIRDVFRVYNIPINLTDRYALNASPPVIAAINLLEIPENDYYYKNILRALSGGYLDNAGINQSNLLRVSVGLKIISGFRNWKNSIEDALAGMNGDDTEEYSVPSISAAEYRKALEDIEIINGLVSPFDRMMSFEEFLDRFASLIYRLNIPLKLVETGGGRVEENVKALTTTIETITEILELFKLEYPSGEKFPLKFYLNNIRTAVNSSRYNIKERQGYGVQITTLGEIRGLKFDYLFIAGLCDGDLPTRYKPEIFYSPSFARNEQKHQAEERYHFYQALCLWEKGLYLTNPSFDEKKELVESNFLTEFTSTFEVSGKSEKDYDQAVCSREELLALAGKKGTGNLISDELAAKLDINPGEINRALEIDAGRISDPFGESGFTGYVLDDLSDEGRKYLEGYSGRQYSVTQLETYALCPYKYFAERVLRLKPVEEPTEDIEALEMGTLLHSILYEFYSGLRKKNILIHKCGDREFNLACDEIFRIAGEKIEKANFHSPVSFFEKEKILGINGDRRNSILYKFMEVERNNESGFTPEFFEVAFGRLRTEGGDENRTNVAFSVNDVNVRGMIDRVDIDAGEKHFKVIDYKLGGKKPTQEDLLSGISLQIPLYMLAARSLVNAQLGGEFDPLEADIYSLKFSDGKFGPIDITKAASGRRKMERGESIDMNNELIKICIESIEKYVNYIVSGKFHLSTLKERESRVCNNCNFKYVCRIQEVN